MSNVITICGSLRKGSLNRMLANTLPALAPAGMNIKASPTIEMPLYNADVQAAGWPPAAVALSDAIRAADGVIIVTPEYNYSMPGGLKNAIDWVSRIQDQPFANKPEIFVGAAHTKFDDKTGELKDEATRTIIKQQLEGFEKFIERHKHHKG